MKRKRKDPTKTTTSTTTSNTTTISSPSKTNDTREIFAQPWLRILLRRLLRVARAFEKSETQIAKVIQKENGMHVVQLPRRNPAVSNQYVIEHISPFAMNMKNFVTAVSWSCLKSREGYDLYYTNMQEAEANSRPAQCIRAMHYFMNAIVASKGVPELVDGRPLSFVASSLHAEFRRVSHCLGVECCISCRRVDWTLRKHPFISGVFFCPVCLVSYLCSTPIFKSLRKLRETSKKDDDEEEEEEDEEEEVMACLCCGRSTVRCVRVRDYQ